MSGCSGHTTLALLEEHGRGQGASCHLALDHVAMLRSYTTGAADDGAPCVGKLVRLQLQYEAATLDARPVHRVNEIWKLNASRRPDTRGQAPAVISHVQTSFVASQKRRAHHEGFPCSTMMLVLTQFALSKFCAERFPAELWSGDQSHDMLGRVVASSPGIAVHIHSSNDRRNGRRMRSQRLRLRCATLKMRQRRVVCC